MFNSPKSCEKCKKVVKNMRKKLRKCEKVRKSAKCKCDAKMESEFASRRISLLEQKKAHFRIFSHRICIALPSMINTTCPKQRWLVQCDVHLVTNEQTTGVHKINHLNHTIYCILPYGFVICPNTNLLSIPH
jgi:hypothetical protein